MAVMPNSTALKSSRSASSRRTTAARMNSGSSMYSVFISGGSAGGCGDAAICRRGRMNQSSMMTSKPTGMASQDRQPDDLKKHGGAF